MPKNLNPHNQDTMNSTLTLILSELKDIKSSNVDIKKDLKEFKSAQEVQTADFRKMFLTIQKENNELKKVVQNLTKDNLNLNSEIIRLSNGLNSLLQDKLANNMIISGIPAKAGENLPHLMMKIADILKMKISPADFKVKRLIPMEDIRAKKINNLLMEFADLKKKNEFLRNRKKINLLSGHLGISGFSTQINFFHHLTTYNIQLLNEARSLKESLDIKFVWFQNNHVLVRKLEKGKILPIKCKTDIQNLNCLFVKKKEHVNGSAADIIDLLSPTKLTI